jgi:glycerol-3-phosphate dehydrogenase
VDDPHKQIPQGREVSRSELLTLLPGIERDRLLGGILFYDGQVYNSERLVLAFLQSAAAAGACVANYAEASGFVRKGDRITGIEARDVLSGDTFAIQARTVINASGPWINRMLGSLGGPPALQQPFAKAVNLVTRPLFQTYAAGLSGKGSLSEGDSGQSEKSRFLFVVPWRDRSLVGTQYTSYEGEPDGLQVAEAEIRTFLNQVNRALPQANLSMEDVSYVHAGLVPAAAASSQTGEPQRANHYKIIDHRRQGLQGLISIMGVKYTTARDVAEKTIDLVFKTWGTQPPESRSSSTPLHGAPAGHFAAFLNEEIRKRPPGLEESSIRRMILTYGSAYREVLGYLDTNPGGKSAIRQEARSVLQAQTIHAVREEMAHTLSDVVLRRTDLGTASHPEGIALETCAEVLAAELGWDASRVKHEMEEVGRKYLLSRTLAHV